MAFCTKCGAELQEGARFCAACGAVVPQPSVDDRAVLNDGEAGASSPAPHRRRPLIIVVVVLAVCAVIAGAVFLAVNVFAPTTMVAQYGTEEALTVSRTAPLSLLDASGSPLKKYVVRVKHAVGLDGKKIDISGIEPFEVEDGGSFTLDDLIGDLPDGTYQLEATDDDDIRYDLPPLIIDDEAPGIPIEVVPPESGETTTPEHTNADRDDAAESEEDAVRTAYASVCTDLIDQHGAPSMEELPLSAGVESIGHRAGAGLTLAVLLDLDGDGSDELIVAYRDKGSATSFEDIFWMVEVWGFAGGNEAVQLYQQEMTTYPDYANLGCLNVYELDGGCAIELPVAAGGGSACLRYTGGDAFEGLFDPQSLLAEAAVIHNYNLNEAPTDLGQGSGAELDFHNLESVIALTRDTLSQLDVEY